MVRPARPVNWNRRNRLINRQGTVSNRPEPKPVATGSKWNRNRNGTGPTRTVAMPRYNVIHSFKSFSIEELYQKWGQGLCECCDEKMQILGHKCRKRKVL